MKKVLGLVAVIVLLFGCERLKETTVSGRVTYGGEAVDGAFVLLLESVSLEGVSLGGGWRTGSDGRYEIIRVAAGDYYVAAIKDENGNLQYDQGTDRVGWYGEEDTLTGLTIPEQITVVERENRTGINIDTLYIVP